jgi:RNA polymerase sigma-70 factor (ECF subfamily)
MDATDPLLMRGIAAGNPAAFQSFFDRHRQAVTQFLFRMLREPADVEDVVQETFLQIWNRSHQYDPTKASPAGWLTLIARSRALDLIRRRKPGRPGNEVEPSFEYDMSLGLVQDESRQHVRDAMAKLPSEQREVIRLAFLGGLTHEQIAGILHVPLGTVKTRIRLGLRRLKHLLPGDDRAGPGD